MVERISVSAEPRAHVEHGWLSGRSPVLFDQVLAVFANGIGEGGIVGERRALLPTVGEQSQTANGKCLDQPRQFRLRLRLPAVAQHMAELVAELIGELGPIARADIDDDPGGVRIFVMKPDVRWPANSRRLTWGVPS
jgi:hypothetical protein